QMIQLLDSREFEREKVEKAIRDLKIKTTLSLDQLIDVFYLYFKGLSDREIAIKLGDVRMMRNVERARIKMGLFRVKDFDAPFDVNKFLDLVREGKKDDEIAEILGAGSSTVRSYRQVFDYYRKYGEPPLED
ncbi:MAG: hypothetical protein ACXQT5_07780, partial [Candidatus Syntropharchaeia archaeon]